jgi:DNA (cytosine-5)-methyltransferase 1
MMRILELYSGIGGCAAAVAGRAVVVAAVDIDRAALAVVRHNFDHPAVARTLESAPSEFFRRGDADLWWLSPPCQPFTRRGRMRDADDRRSESLAALVGHIAELRPRHVALENVPPFLDSRMRRHLVTALAAGGYKVRERILCPSEMGIPNRRRRYYLVASRDRLVEWPPLPRRRFRLADVLEAEPCEEVFVPPSLAARYAGAIDVVDPADDGAIAACFTSAYGRSPVRSGSYVATPRGPRRFSPREILRLLGFGESFAFPLPITLRQAWGLAGNSLSIPAVRFVLSAIPELAEASQPSSSAILASTPPAGAALLVAGADAPLQLGDKLIVVERSHQFGRNRLPHGHVNHGGSRQ